MDFHVPCTILFTVHFHAVISMFHFLCYWSHSKAINSSLFLLKIYHRSVNQSNVQAVTVENEEEYTLSNIIYIKFQNCCLFCLRPIMKEVLQKCTQTCAPLQEFSKIFAHICSFLQRVSRNFTNFCFQENLLVAAANRCKVLKIFISINVTVYIQGRKTTVWENLRCFAFRMEI